MKYINVANTFIPLYQMILLHVISMEMYCVSFKKNTENKSSGVKGKKENR